jgi:hypothetical protein
MISELYQKVLENELGRARYLLLLMIVGTLQILKQAKLEILAEVLPIPIYQIPSLTFNLAGKWKKPIGVLKQNNFGIF